MSAGEPRTLGFTVIGMKASSRLVTSAFQTVSLASGWARHRCKYPWRSARARGSPPMLLFAATPPTNAGPLMMSAVVRSLLLPPMSVTRHPSQSEISP